MRKQLDRWVDYAGGRLAPDLRDAVERELLASAPEPAQLGSLLTRLRRVALSRQPWRAGAPPGDETLPVLADEGPGSPIELHPFSEPVTARAREPRRAFSVCSYAGSGHRLDLVISLEEGQEAGATGVLLREQQPVRGPIGLACEAGRPLALLEVDAMGEFSLTRPLPRRFYLVVDGEWLGVRR